MSDPANPEIPRQMTDAGVPDYSDPSGDDYEALSRDHVAIRSMRADDLAALVRIDKAITGRERLPYFETKLAETMGETRIRVSMVAEEDDRVVGFIMARVDFGEFGHTEPEAVIDTLGVHPAFADRRIGRALVSQLLANLGALKADQVRTEVAWNNFALLRFLERCGFRPSQRVALSRIVD
jgi:ribosomal protein S18 acetylase RimI-like enzyme